MHAQIICDGTATKIDAPRKLCSRFLFRLAFGDYLLGARFGGATFGRDVLPRHRERASQRRLISGREVDVGAAVLAPGAPARAGRSQAQSRPVAFAAPVSASPCPIACPDNRASRTRGR